MSDRPNVGALLDRPLGAYRIAVFLLCALVMALEGFDMYMIGSIVPAIASGLGIGPAAMGQVFVAQGIGLAIGYTFVSPIADRAGRRPVILGCVTGFALVTLLAVLAQSVTALAVLRLVAFIFFGGVVPNTIALVTELSPRLIRQRMVVLLNAVFAVGSSAGMIIAPVAAANFGWTGAFWAAGLAPLLLLPLLVWALPESPRFLVLRPEGTERLRRVLSRIGAGAQADVATGFTTDEKPETRAPLASLFAPERIRTTLLLIVMGSMMMIVANIVPSWLPTYMQMLAGYSTAHAAAVIATSSLGAIVWPLCMIVLIRRIGIKATVALSYAFGTVSMALFAVQPLTALPATLMSIGFGAFVIGAVGGVYAMTSTLYPTSMRSTALGFTAGMARLLSIAGPAIGSFMLTQHFSQQGIAMVLSLPLAIALAATLALRLPRPVRPD
ncbi:MAG: MFS transporter [Sphingomonadales bacterium]|nr:MFS transporter [Sphingomonadales bacterium]